MKSENEIVILRITREKYETLRKSGTITANDLLSVKILPAEEDYQDPRYQMKRKEFLKIKREFEQLQFELRNKL